MRRRFSPRAGLPQCVCVFVCVRVCLCACMCVEQPPRLFSPPAEPQRCALLPFVNTNNESEGEGCPLKWAWFHPSQRPSWLTPTFICGVFHGFHSCSLCCMSSEIVCFFSQSQQITYVVNASYKTVNEVTENLGGEFQDLHSLSFLPFLNETIPIFRS